MFNHVFSMTHSAVYQKGTLLSRNRFPNSFLSSKKGEGGRGQKKEQTQPSKTPWRRFTQPPSNVAQVHEQPHLAELMYSIKMVTRTSNQPIGTSHCKQVPVCCTLAYTSQSNQNNNSSWLESQPHSRGRVIPHVEAFDIQSNNENENGSEDLGLQGQGLYQNIQRQRRDA